MMPMTTISSTRENPCRTPHRRYGAVVGDRLAILFLVNVTIEEHDVRSPVMSLDRFGSQDFSRIPRRLWHSHIRGIQAVAETAALICGAYHHPVDADGL